MTLSYRQRRILIFLLSFALIALVLSWMFVIDRGTLEVTALPPYRINVIKGIQKSCLSDPCLIRLFPRTYSAILEKEGYYPEKISFSIRRFETTRLSISPKFVPKETHIFPLTPNSFQQSNFESITLTPPAFSDTFLTLASTTNGLLFSPDGQFALIFTDKDLLFSETQGSYETLEIPPVKDIVWSHQSDFLLYLDAHPRQQSLYRFDWHEKSTHLISRFPRFIERGQLFLSADDTTVILLDQDRNTVYLVDLEKKSRQKILEVSNISYALLSPSHRFLLYDSFSKWHLYDIEERTTKDLDLVARLDSLVWTRDDSIVAATSQPLRIVDHDSWTEVQFSKKDTSSGPKIKTDKIFVEYLPSEDVYRLFYEPHGDVKRLFLDGEKLFFVMNSEVHELTLAP